jgi:hypothetical protein
MKVIIAFLSLFYLSGFAQNSKELMISYGESISLGKIEDDTTFSISSQFGTITLKGNEINNYIFSKPGNYMIKVNEIQHVNSESCNHNHFPKEISLIVSRVKMTFDGTKIKFSEQINKNKDTNGITLSIPVTIESFDNKPVTLNNSIVNSAGIGTSIVAKLNDKMKELPIGTHLINYELSGKVTENSYLMFDFVDANGLIQSVTLVNPIQN